MAKKKLGVPSKEQIGQLPRWAQVAFAARCARRVQPVAWPDAPKNYRQAIEVAIASAEHAAAHGAPDGANARRAAAGARAARRDAVHGVHAAAAAAHAAHGAAYAVYTARAAAHAATYAARAVASHVVIRAMRADFDRLRVVAKKEKWTNKTPVPPEFFGPLWPEGAPPGWPFAQIKEEMAIRVHELKVPQQTILGTRAGPLRQEKLLVHAIGGESVDDDSLVDGILRLYKALNKYHILCGGSGLTIDDWQIRVSARERTGVLV